ncbi:hypothetical protein TNCV_2739661 [Trichonephila clavipes]|nr:hypothetical protein TNCV_2739661 [Trichonephila clavipes]
MPIIKELPRGYILQHNGTPCHYHNDVTSYLNSEVPVWIGRGGVIQFPPRLSGRAEVDMPLRRFRRQYEQLSQFERGRIIDMMGKLGGQLSE